MAATGLASGNLPEPALAAAAVRQALARMNSEIAGSVLLFLTAEFGRHVRTAQAAVTAAARSAQCLAVTGCTAPGVFTEAGWILDRPAAAVLVLPVGMAFGAASGSAPRLSFATRAVATPNWLAAHDQRFGLLADTGIGQPGGRVWQRGRLNADDRCETMLSGGALHIAVARGIRALGPPVEIVSVKGHELTQLRAEQDIEPALDNLRRVLPPNLARARPLPLHLIYAAIVADAPTPNMVSATSSEAIASGDYTLVPLLAAELPEHGARSVTLASRVAPGTRLFWCLREPMTSERELRKKLHGSFAASAFPSCAVMCSCIGRGPYFYGPEDRDRLALKEHFPRLPFVGAYGTGEIAPHAKGSRILDNSVVIALMQADVQS